MGGRGKSSGRGSGKMAALPVAKPGKPKKQPENPTIETNVRSILDAANRPENKQRIFIRLATLREETGMSVEDFHAAIKK